MPTEWRLLCWLAPVWRHKNTWYSSPAAWISNKYSLSRNREQLLWQTCDNNWAVLHYTECKNKKRQKVSSDKQRSVSETNKVTLDPQWYQLVKQVIKQDRPEACFIHFWMLMRTLQNAHCQVFSLDHSSHRVQQKMKLANEPKNLSFPDRLLQKLHVCLQMNKFLSDQETSC